MPNNGSRYHAEVKVSIEGHDCRLNIFADTLHEIFADIGTVCGQFPREWSPAPSSVPAAPPVQPQSRTPASKGAQPIDAKGRPLPASDDLASDVPACAHCGDWSGMELIEFQSKKDGKTRRAWKCQACDKWHFPNNKK